MPKVYISRKPSEKYKEELKCFSNDYEFVYEEDESVDIIIGKVKPDKLKNYKNLKWYQSDAVGVDAYTKKGVLAKDVILTNAKDIHTKEVAEHTFAMILSCVKKLPLYQNDQKKHQWEDEGEVKEYSKLKVCIVGLGDIGKYLAKLLKALGVYVIAVKRKQIAKPEYIDELYLDKELDKAISNVDVVVSILPGSGNNVHLFTPDTFKAMARDTIFINVGRGNLYSEETLKEVLEQKLVALFVSDVFESEPLDSSSPLWDYDNLIITPHVAGGYHLQSASDAFFELCLENLKRYKENRELLNIVNERFDK